MIVPIARAIKDPNLLKKIVPSKTYGTWEVIFRAMDALPPEPGDLETFTALTGRTKWPTKPAREIWIIAGRRSGKTLAASLIAASTAALTPHALNPGERGTIAVISPVKAQSRIIANYVFEAFHVGPMLESMVDFAGRWEIRLQNNIDIQILSSDFRTLRGFSCPLVILEEIAFFNTEGAKPDDEVLRAVRPALATLNGRLIGISSPYSRRGILWEIYKKHWSVNDSDVLVIQAESRQLNPTLDQAIIDTAMDEDPSGSQAEWFGQFRSDIETFIDEAVVLACITPGCYERAPIPGQFYSAFTDPAGGSGKDSFTLAICHSEKGVKILDLIRETKPPFSPEITIKEYAETLKKYGCHSVIGDRFSGGFAPEQFQKHGVRYVVSDRPKSDLYRDALPLFNSGKVDLLDHAKLVSQLTNLERRTSRGGRDSIDHPPRSHDDVANSVAGCLVSGKSLRRAGPLFR